MNWKKIGIGLLATMGAVILACFAFAFFVFWACSHH